MVDRKEVDGTAAGADKKKRSTSGGTTKKHRKVSTKSGTSATNSKAASSKSTNSKPASNKTTGTKATSNKVTGTKERVKHAKADGDSSVKEVVTEIKSSEDLGNKTEQDATKNDLQKVTFQDLNGVFPDQESKPASEIKAAVKTDELKDVSSTNPPPVIPTNMEAEIKSLEEERDLALKESRRGTQSFGLLIMRLLLGGLLLHSGYTRLFGEVGIDKSKAMVKAAGFDYSNILGILYAVLPFGLGIFILLGLATPVVSSLAAGLTLLEYFVEQGDNSGITIFSGETAGYLFEYYYALFFISVALVFTGPGTFSLDIGRKWTKRPFMGSILIFLVIIGSALAIWALFNGSKIFY